MGAAAIVLEPIGRDSERERTSWVCGWELLVLRERSAWLWKLRVLDVLLAEATTEEGSRRMMMLLAVRLSVVRAGTSLPTPSPASSSASHSRPSSYGFVNGEPLRLSMLSSFRGQRGGGGNVGVFGGCGIAGLKVEVEGTRTTWRAREAAVGLVGDDGAGVVPVRKRGADGMRASLRGLWVWEVTRDLINQK
jgi:hypothetical protein